MTKELIDKLRNHRLNRHMEIQAARIAELTAENTAIRALINCYNLGGWTDSLTLMQERDSLRAKLEELEKQEPVCYASINKQGDVCSTLKHRDGWRRTPLYLAAKPTVRELSDDEARELWLFEAGKSGYNTHELPARFARAVLAAARSDK